MTYPGLLFGQSLTHKQLCLSFLAFSLALVVNLLPSCTASLASETKTDLDKIYDDVDNSRKASAMSRVDAYLKQHPENVDVLSIRARYLVMANKNAEAERILRHALTIRPNDSRLWGGLSFVLINKKDFKNAYLAAVKADQYYLVDPIYTVPDSGLLKNLFLLSQKINHPQDAVKYQLKVKQFELTEAARNYREQGMLDKALDNLNRIIKDDPKCTFAYLLRGVIYNNRSEHPKAIKDFDTVIALQPNMTTAYYIRGDSYFDMGNKAKALESWKQVLKVHPAAFPDLVAFAYVAMTGRFREHFEPNDAMVVNRADIYYLCGVAESDLKQYDQAAKDYGQCIALDKGEYKAYFERAVMNERLNRSNLVMADLDQAINLNAKYIEALLERAKLYEKKHDNSRAFGDYSSVIAVNPSDFGAYILRADLAARIKNYEQAIADYTQAIKLSPAEDDPLVGRAKVYTTLARYDDAIADYKKAMRLNPQDRAVVLDAMAKVEKLKNGRAVSVR
jgi:tetratricopeptide (TPR) repeat protein